MTLTTRRAKRQLTKFGREVDRCATQFAGASLAVEGIMKIVKETKPGCRGSGKGSHHVLISRIEEIKELVDLQSDRRTKDKKTLEKLSARLQSLADNYGKSYDPPPIKKDILRSKVEPIKQEHKKKIADAIWRAMDVIECELEKRVPNLRRLAKLEGALETIDNIVKSFTEYYLTIQKMEEEEPELQTQIRQEHVRKENGKRVKDVKMGLRSTLKLVIDQREEIEAALHGILKPESTEVISSASAALRAASKILEEARTLPSRPGNADALAGATEELKQVFYKYLLESPRMQRQEPVGAGFKQ